MKATLGLALGLALTSPAFAEEPEACEHAEWLRGHIEWLQTRDTNKQVDPQRSSPRHAQPGRRNADCEQAEHDRVMNIDGNS
jgi:hypothetical protein